MSSSRTKKKRLWKSDTAGRRPGWIPGGGAEAAAMHEALTMLPEVQVRLLLAGRPLRLEILRPPYPALGVGALRVLRIREHGSLLDLVAGYENYERLG